MHISLILQITTLHDIIFFDCLLLLLLQETSEVVLLVSLSVVGLVEQLYHSLNLLLSVVLTRVGSFKKLLQLLDA